MKTKKNEYVVAVVTKILLVIIGMIESIIFARYLGASINGQVSYINSFVQIIYIILTLGIYTAYPYYRKLNGKDEILCKMMSISTVLFVFYLAVAILLSILFFNNIELVCIFLVSPILFYDKIVSFIWMIEYPNKRNKIVLFANICKFIYYIFAVLFIKRNLIAGVITLVAAPIVETIYFYFKTKYKFSKQYISLKDVKKLVSYGILPMITVLMTTLNYRIDVIMLKMFDNITLSSIGVYSIGLALAEKVFIVSDAVKEILLSKLAKGRGEEEVARVMRISFCLSLVIALCITIFSYPFIHIFYGKEYFGADVIANISVWGTAFMVFFKMISQYNVANKKQKYNVYFLSISILINIVLNIILIPILGINGAAITTAIGYLVSSLLFVLYFRKISGISFRDLTIINTDDLNLIKKYFKK